jgi:hypothetical protein
MRGLIFVWFVFVLMSTAARAQDTAFVLSQMISAQSIKTVAKSLEATTLQVQRQVVSAAPGTDEKSVQQANERIQPANAKLLERVRAVTASPEGLEEVRKMVEEALRKTYTPKELSVMLAFYRSPQGAPIIAKSGDLQIAMSAEMPAFVSRSLTPLMKDYLDEVKTILTK